jgi:two-component system phosphate regulon response regulator PhoB
MASERILVIDDAEGMRNLLGLSLVQEGFQLFFADCGQAGLAAMVREFPDAVILDLTLPDMDGLEVCRLLKDNPATALVPILMLTGRCEEADVIRGLEMGADDYLIKPCSPRVLCARLRAVLRRRNGEGNTGAALLQLHDLVIDPAKGEVRSGEAWVIPPASPETTLVLRIASRSEVLPWSTWPMIVMTGGRSTRSVDLS